MGAGTIKLRGLTKARDADSAAAEEPGIVMLVEGQILGGRYELTSSAGGGGMASVYRARDTRLGRMVAIKVLHAQYGNDLKAIQRFQREAEFSAGLSAHPNIVSVYDVGHDGGFHYMVMELIDGRSLKDMISSSGRLPVPEALHIAREVAAALDFAHRYGLVHRDIKPQNIMVGTDGSVKVTDFGIAYSVDASQLTKEGAVLGTAVYLSPEQARGKGSTPASDVYSLGVVLYEMLTGRPPFQADTAIATAMQHIQKTAPPPGQLSPSVPAWLDAVVMRSLSKNPSDRYASAAQFREAMINRESTGKPGDRSESRTRPARAPIIPATGPQVRPRRLKLPNAFGFLSLVIVLVALLSVVMGDVAYRLISDAISTSPTAPVTHHKEHKGNHHKGTVTPTPTPTPAGPTLSSGQLTMPAPFTYDTPTNTLVIYPSQSISVTYTIDDLESYSGQVQLQVTLEDAAGNTITDQANNKVVRVQPGTATYSRTFTIPASAPSERFTVIAAVSNPAGSLTYVTQSSPLGQLAVI